MSRDGHYGALRRLLYALLWLGGNLFFRVYFRMRVRGRPRPFPRGALVLAANHASYLDPILLGLSVPRRVTYLVSSSVYFLPAYRPWMWLFGAIPVQDESINVEAMRRALAALKRGEVVGIFPEGGITPDGRLQEGKIGVAALLRSGGAPVQTVALLGTRRALRKGAAYPRPSRVEAVFSDVVRPDQLDDLAPREARRELRDRVMAGIARGLPEEMRPAPPA
jgi:1-acyl-sn-glycerol-3-phosphate acyltransferase